MLRPLLVSAALLAGCATPVAPTGGPADTTPPVLVETLPADGATNVAGRTVTLTFSERLDARAGAAVTVTPAADTPAEVTVRGRTVEVTLPALRDSTTYVVTVGTELRDQRSVALRQPITVAFATGDAIDRARLSGAVRDPRTGAGAGGLAVWAYALADTTDRPDPRTAAPDYRTETGDDGAFRLDYLRPGRYLVAAVADRNRNGRADPGEPFAAPPRPALRADTSETDPVVMWRTVRDTIPPQAQRVRPASNRRFSVRFDEPVRLRSPSADGWAVADSASGRAVGVRLYQPASAPFEVFALADRDLSPTVHRVSFAPPDSVALADSAGLAPSPFTLSFTPPARPDTAGARFAGLSPRSDSTSVLPPGVVPVARFTSLPTAEQLARLSVRVDGAASGAAFLSDDGVTYRPAFDERPRAFAVRYEGPDSVYVQRYAVPDARDVGGILGRVEGGGAVRVEIRSQQGETLTVAADADGAFVADGLVPGTYTLRIWADLDGDGRWTGGSLAPYAPPEPLVVRAEPVTVRARWETELDPVRLGGPADEPTEAATPAPPDDT